MNNVEQLLKEIIVSADAKKASNISALDLQGLTTITDYFVLATAGSNRQVEAVVNEIEDNVKKNLNIVVKRIEGKEEKNWVVMDFEDVIVHIFDEETRDFYKLDKLWSDAKSVDISAWITED